MDISIVSLNTLGLPFAGEHLFLRYKVFSEYFNSSDIDILMFQEVFTYGHLHLLKKYLTNYPYISYQKTISGPKGGLVIFARLPMAKTKYILFEKTFNLFDMTGIESLLKKGMLVSEFKNHEILLVNTHFNAVHDSKWHMGGAYYGLIMNEINQFHNLLTKKASGKLIVAAGDFNIQKGTPLYRQLMSKKSLTDVFSSQKSFTYRSFSNINKKFCIDYMFIYGRSSMYKIKERKKIFTDRWRFDKKKSLFISDHVALSVSLRINL